MLNIKMTYNFNRESILLGSANSVKVRKLKAFRKQQEQMLHELEQKAIEKARDLYVQEQIDLLTKPVIGYKLSEENLQLVLNNCKIFKKYNLTVD